MALALPKFAAITRNLFGIFVPSKPEEAVQQMPNGESYLHLLQSLESQSATEFDCWIPTAGRKAPATYTALGTALSYLDRIGSCWWGCDGGDHGIERLAGRAISNARAALILLRTGHYDEGLDLVRQIGEVANLMCLFFEKQGTYEDWMNAAPKQRRKKFGPGNVRHQLEALGLPFAIDSRGYGRLSSRFVHPHPEATPQGFNIRRVPTMGGMFQEVGALDVLNELAWKVGFLLWLAAILVEPKTELNELLEAAHRLLESIGRADINSIDEYFATIRGKSP